MSADKQIEVKVNTDNGSVHSAFMFWAAKVREQPSVRITREALLAYIKDDPKMASVVEEIKQKVHKDSTMFITEAGSGADAAGPQVTMTVRYG